MPKSSEYVLKKIRSSFKISDFFAERGILPEKKYHNWWAYVCPLHKDTDPSMALNLPGAYSEHEFCYCFGCKAAADIIGMKAQLDYPNDSHKYKKAINYFSKKLNLSVGDEVDFLINELKLDISTTFEKIDINNEIEKMSLMISGLGYEYLKKTGGQDFDFIEQLHKKIDILVRRSDYSSLKEAYDYITDNQLFKKRLEKIEEINREKIKKQIEDEKLYGKIKH